MKNSQIFHDYLGSAATKDVFKHLKNTLTDSITIWNYFVNWQKVLLNFKSVEIHLNTLNYLIGKANIEQEFRELLQIYPGIYSTIPLLIACRTKNFRILTSFTEANFQYKGFNFSNQSLLFPENIEAAVEFARETGVLELFENRTIKSIPDYVLGIEVGLDSNGRKNRGGDTMEIIVQELVKSICSANNLTYIKQATAEKILTIWDTVVEVDKSSRRFDFAINNQGLIYLIEVNFYGGGGSKLKATAGEYKTLYDFLSAQNHKFIWITDGLGWKTSLKPLEETFNYIEYTLNLNMASSGLLAEIIKQKL
ncbi:type-2 restriction enzyme DpnII [Calothrix sp. NIES-4071]|nr:type-2 restriction enzyme DpnII [Calothrix sp. NIES-4071]BAZ60108.1 type-2 restriction enzyme DpnII [Calothrix sp. NIES-4105]